MVKKVKPTAAVASTSLGVLRWSASAPIRPVQPARVAPSKGVVHHVPGRPAGPGHLADRLLREDRRDPRAGPEHRRDMPGRGQADPVAEAEARAQTQGDAG